MKRLEFKIRKLLAGNFFGYFQSIFKGEGLEIEDFRSYEVGDDVKHINWKLTAKFGKLFINIFRAEKDVQFHLFFDINYNRKGDIQESNLNLVKEFFLDISIFAKRYGGELVLYYPIKNQIHHQYIGRNLTKVYGFTKNLDELVGSTPNKYISNIGNFIKLQKNIIKRHVIVIISDFLGITNRDIKYLKAMLEKNEILLFKLNIGKVGKNYDILDMEDINIDLGKIFGKDKVISII